MKGAWLVPLAAAAALSALYLDSAYAFAQSGIIQKATAAEQFVFTLQFAKMGTVAAFRRFRDTRFVNIINVLGAEVVVALPVLALATVALGSQTASSLSSQIFLAWIAGASAALAPYSIYRLAKAMIRRDPLLIVLPSGILLSELLLLLKSGTESAVASGLGLPGMSRTIILLGGGSMMTGTQLEGLVTLIPLSILYVTFLLHSLSPEEGGRTSRLVGTAGFAVLVTSLTYAGTLAASSFALPFAYFVLPPTLSTATLLWWTTREA